ncbi:MAG: Bug family tripartite tricarboxylate transporter substrate binding protein [Beijerinckiaceae bacterium]
MRDFDRRQTMQTLLAAGALPLLTTHTLAQAGRTVRLVVPAAPGGAIDAIGRLFASRLKETLNENWIVENKAGANNTLGAAEVARAQADGTTFLTNADIQIMARHVMKQVPYDPIADFTPISRFATSPLVLVGHPGKTPADIKILTREMLDSPDKHTFGNSALGAMGHLASERFKSEIGAKTLIVSYRGTAPALQDVLAGQTTLMVAPVGSAAQHISAGTLRAYAVMSAARSSLLPQTPTMAELGFPGLNFTLWYGLWGPKDLPAAIIRSVSDAVQAGSRDPDLVQKLRALGAEPVSETPDAFAQFIAQEAVKSAEIVKLAGIQPQG